MNSSDVKLNVGLFSIGLDTYWPQFPGLRERLAGSTERVARKLEASQVQVTNVGLIDTPEKSVAAGHELRKADVDLIFLYVTTYALSSTVLPAVRRAKVPVVILNLAPSSAIDYDTFNRLGDRTKMTGEWLAYCQACPIPEIANVFNRCRIPFFQVTGMLENDPVAWAEVNEWIEAARVAWRDFFEVHSHRETPSRIEPGCTGCAGPRGLRRVRAGHKFGRTLRGRRASCACRRTL